MKRLSQLLIPLLTMSIFVSCNSSKKVSQLTPRGIMLEDPYCGSWDFVVDAPNGAAEGVLVIEKSGYSNYVASVSSEMGEMSIEKMSIEGERLKGSFKYKGFRVNVQGEFEGDMLEGKIGVTLISYPLTARKRSAGLAVNRD